MKYLHSLLIGAALLVSLSSKAQITVDLKAYLEGPYFSGAMTPWLNVWGFIPLNQPYNTGPWHYFGTEHVTAMPNADVVDWVLVELRRSSGPAFTAFIDSTVARQAAFILKNGKIVGLDGVSKLQFDISSTPNLYVVVRHRNHSNVMSAYPLQVSGGLCTYDFTNAVDKAYGGQNAHKQIGPGVWGKISSDGNADGQVNQSDKIDIWTPQSGTSGYKEGDFNMNSQVSQQDKNDYWKPNSGRSSQVPGWAIVPPGNTNPVALFQLMPPGGSTNTLFSLDASASYDAQTRSNLLAVRWDFDNDGTWDTPYGYGKTTTHHYLQPGTFTIKMEVIDMGGLSGTKTQAVAVAVGVGCEGVDTVDYAGKIYHAVEIGKQCWLKENLDVGTMINGNGNQTNNGIIEKFCYNDNSVNCDVYGGLYQWGEVMQYVTTSGVEGICPSGWHVPTDDEWKVLEGNADNQYPVGDTVWENTWWRGSNAGGELKETGTVHWYAPNTGATNSTQFSMLPGGYRPVPGTYDAMKAYGLFWTSSEYSPAYASYRSFKFNLTKAYRAFDNKEYSFSVRCLRDNINLPPTEPINPQPSDGAPSVDIPVLSWSCSDPNGDIICYSIYFGTAANPPLLVSRHPYCHYTLPSINPNTLYHWRVVATDMHGDSISGATWSLTTGSFVCGDNVIDTRVGGNNEVYPTVLIGSQCWMKKNMNYGYMVPGSQDQENNGIPERYCSANQLSNCDVYGGLYQWAEMMQYSIISGTQGICTSGWHIPKEEEWRILEGSIDSLHRLGDPVWEATGWRGADAGGNLKESGTTHWAPPNTGATNSSGFTALPGGHRGPNGYFYDLTLAGDFWSSSENGSNALGRILDFNNAQVNRNNHHKYFGFSVRCLRDMNQTNQPPAQPSNPTPPNNSINHPVSTTLSWTCSDPEGDVLTYDIYLETDSIPVRVKANHTGTEYKPVSLISGATYYWRIVAKDPHGNFTAGNIWKFTTEFVCGGALQDTRDGQTYGTVQIGAQCWMTENLNIGTMIDGANDQANNSTIEKYCFDNITTNCDTYGGLYQWNEMMQYISTQGAKGICPDGWHLPTDGEWCVLEQYVDPTINCSYSGWGGVDGGGKLKEAGNAHWSPPNTGATNASGFTGLPGGFRDYSNGPFYYLTYDGYFWSSSENGSSAWCRNLNYSNAQVYRNERYKTYGFSVRCIRDTQPTWNCGDPFIDTRDNQTYNTVQIGAQCWMAENLNVGTIVNGTYNQTNNGTVEKYCYGDNPGNCDVYGGLYQWDEMMQYLSTAGEQGICPLGWHLPNNQEYCVLTQFIDPTVDCSVVGWTGTDVGIKMKSTTGWYGGGNGTNASGFMALPGGFRTTYNTFEDLTYNGYWWSSSESGSNGWRWHLSYNSNTIHRGNFNKDFGNSVRCLRNLSKN